MPKFGDLTYGQYIPTYVGAPIEQAQSYAATAKGVGDTLQGIYHKEKDKTDMLKILAETQRVDVNDPAAVAAKESALSEIDEGIASIGPAFENATAKVSNMTRNFAANEPFRAAKENYERREAHQKNLQQMRSNGFDPVDVGDQLEGWTQDDGQGGIKYFEGKAERRYDHPGTIDGLWAKVSADLTADPLLAGQLGLDGTDSGYLKRNKWEKLSKKKIGDMSPYIMLQFEQTKEYRQLKWIEMNEKGFSETEAEANIEAFVLKSGLTRQYSKDLGTLHAARKQEVKDKKKEEITDKEDKHLGYNHEIRMAMPNNNYKNIESINADIESKTGIVEAQNEMWNLHLEEIGSDVSMSYMHEKVALAGNIDQRINIQIRRQEGILRGGVNQTTGQPLTTKEILELKNEIYELRYIEPFNLNGLELFKEEFKHSPAVMEDGRLTNIGGIMWGIYEKAATSLLVLERAKEVKQQYQTKALAAEGIVLAEGQTWEDWVAERVELSKASPEGQRRADAAETAALKELGAAGLAGAYVTVGEDVGMMTEIAKANVAKAREEAFLEWSGVPTMEENISDLLAIDQITLDAPINATKIRELDTESKLYVKSLKEEVLSRMDPDNAEIGMNDITFADGDPRREDEGWQVDDWEDFFRKIDDESVTLEGYVYDPTQKHAYSLVFQPKAAIEKIKQTGKLNKSIPYEFDDDEKGYLKIGAQSNIEAEFARFNIQRPIVTKIQTMIADADKRGHGKFDLARGAGGEYVVKVLTETDKEVNSEYDGFQYEVVKYFNDGSGNTVTETMYLSDITALTRDYLNYQLAFSEKNLVPLTEGK